MSRDDKSSEVCRVVELWHVVHLDACSGSGSWDSGNRFRVSGSRYPIQVPVWHTDFSQVDVLVNFVLIRQLRGEGTRAGVEDVGGPFVGDGCQDSLRPTPNRQPS